MRPPLPAGNPQAAAALAKYTEAAEALAEAARAFTATALPLVELGYNPGRIYAAATVAGLKTWPRSQLQQFAVSVLAESSKLIASAPGTLPMAAPARDQ